MGRAKAKALGTDAADAGRVLVGGSNVAEPFHGDALEDGNDEEADLNQGRPHVLGDAGDEAEQDGGEGGNDDGDGDVHLIGGGAGGHLGGRTRTWPGFMLRGSTRGLAACKAAGLMP